MSVQALQKNVDREALIAELDFHLSLVAIGAILGVVPFILQQQAFVVFLYLPVIFYILLGEMITSIRSIQRLSS